MAEATQKKGSKRKAAPRAKTQAVRKRAPKTRPERVKSKEDAIIRAAYEMILSRGFADTTVSDIAKSAGVAEGTLYLYFNNKTALARAVLTAFYQEITDGAQRGVQKRETTKARLEFLARHHLTRVIEGRRILELIYAIGGRDEPSDGGDVRDLNRAYVAVFDQVIRDGVWRGDIGKNITPWVVRDIFYGALEYSMRTMLIRKREKEINRVVRELVQMILRKEAGAPAHASLNDLESLAATADRVEQAALRIEEALTVKNDLDN